MSDAFIRRILTSSGEVVVALSDGAGDLDGILSLQRTNLQTALPEDVALRDGFVTVAHTREILAHMHQEAPSVVARSGSEVVGYALTMPRECRSLLPILEPMFAMLDTLEHRGAPLSRSRYYVMGQICIADRFRGAGLFDAMYAHHRSCFADRFDVVVTEVSCRNGRSLRAHERVGFETLKRFRDATDEWAIILLDFR
jgi:ribosomal protein S18 acetylase RimI-like enzyme